MTDSDETDVALASTPIEDHDAAPSTDTPAGDTTPTAVTQLERRDHDRATTRRLFGAVFLLSVLCIGLLLLSGFLVMKGPTIQDFAVTKDLRVIKLTALNKPMVDDETVRNWSANAVRRIYSFDFENWRNQLNATRSLFTDPAAFSSFVKAMKASGIVQTVRANRLVVSSILRKPPKIVAKGIKDGRMSWKLKVPITVHYESSSSSTSKQYAITLLVQRVHQTVNPRGLGITQLVGPKQ